MEYLFRDFVSHFTVIDAQNFEHLIFLDHFYDVLRHLLRQLIVTEIKSEKALKLTDSIDDIFRHTIRYLKLLHF